MLASPSAWPVRVACVQFRAIRSDPQASREALCALVAQAARFASLVVTPEMAVSGYVFEGPEDAQRVAETTDGPTITALQAIARAHRSWIVHGFAERTRDGELYNSAAVLDPEGDLRVVYRKTALFELDTRWARAGEGAYPLMETAFGTLAVGICMDMNDPAFRAWIYAHRPDVLAFPTNWLDEGLDVTSYWAALIGGAGSLLVAANTWGSESHVRFRGHSAILAGRRVCALAPYEGDGVLWADRESGAVRQNATNSWLRSIS